MKKASEFLLFDLNLRSTKKNHYIMVKLESAF